MSTILGACLALPLSSLWGQSTEAPAVSRSGGQQASVATPAITAEQLEQLGQEYPAPEGDQPASSDYRNVETAKDALEQAQQYDNQLSALKTLVNTAKSDTQSLQEQIKLEKEAPPDELPSSLTEAEGLLDRLQGELDSTNSTVLDLKNRISQFPELKLAATNKVNELRARLNELKKEESGTATEKAVRQARIQQYEAQASLLQRQINTADLRRHYRNAQRELAETKAARLHQQVEALSKHVEKLRQQALSAQEQDAQDALARTAIEDPVLKRIAEQNQAWIETRKDLTPKIEAQDKEAAEYTELTQQTQARLQKIQQRLAIAGHSQTVGTLLHRELRSLPSSEKLESTQDDLNDFVRDIQLKLFDLEQERDKAGDTDQRLVEYRKQLPLLSNPQEQSARDKLLQDLLAQRVEILNGLVADTENYFEAVVNTSSSVDSAIATLNAFEEFAAENALWIPDRDRISGKDFLLLPDVLGDISQRALMTVGQVFSRTLERLIVTIVGVIALFIIARRISHKLRPLRTRLLSEANFSDTLLLLGFEIALTGVPVLLLLGIAWTVDTPGVNNSFSDALGYTCISFIPGTISLTLLYRLSLATNLGANHFRWSEQSCRVINRTVKTLMLPAFILAFAGGFLFYYGLLDERNTGSRALYLITLILIIFGFRLVFHPDRGVFADSGMRFGPLQSAPVRWFIYVFLVGWATMLAVMISLGYMAAVMSLIRTTAHTIWLLVAIAVIHGLLSRYLRIHRYQAIVQERASRVVENAGGEDTREDETGLPIEQDENENPSWREIDPQIRHILNLLRMVLFIVGLFFVWHDALPAFRTISGYAILGSSNAPILTLGQLAMLGICLATTIVMAKNLPSVIEIVILRRLKSITSGNRHAFSTLVSYFIVICGIIWASLIAEVEWSKIQWLIAAISVGLGFGLQEIFGNLVAGIILLFERPIRVGDIVTIDDTTGSIARIRIRGTTIREFDRREVIVPNKTIITGKLINWTLSDTMTRLKLPVGVAYGTDTDRVTRILLEILENNPNVLSDPEPRVFFMEMADSSLNFLCFAYLESMDNRLGTQSDLNHAIVQRLEKEGIEIPFPQRTLHVVRDDAVALSTSEESPTQTPETDLKK